MNKFAEGFITQLRTRIKQAQVKEPPLNITPPPSKPDFGTTPRPVAPKPPAPKPVAPKGKWNPGLEPG